MVKDKKYFLRSTQLRIFKAQRFCEILKARRGSFLFLISTQVHGHLQYASKLACEYINAVQGDGTKFFGLSVPLNATSSPVWLPHNLFDQLLLELKENRHDPVYHKVSELQTFIHQFKSINPFNLQSVSWNHSKPDILSETLKYQIKNLSQKLISPQILQFFYRSLNRPFKEIEKMYNNSLFCKTDCIGSDKILKQVYRMSVGLH